MIALFIFVGIVVVYTSLALLVERRNGQPSHDQRMRSVTTYSSDYWYGGGGFGGGGGEF